MNLYDILPIELWVMIIKQCQTRNNLLLVDQELSDLVNFVKKPTEYVFDYLKYYVASVKRLLWTRKQNEYPWVWTKSVSLLVIKSGNLDVVKWCRKKGSPWHDWSCPTAAEYGYFEILKWLCQESQYVPIHNRDRWICAYAAKGGYLKILMWLRTQKPPCPWDETTCENAAKGGHLEVLKWARTNGCPWDLPAAKDPA